MVASKGWIAEAANVFVQEVGTNAALRTIKRLKKIPAANKSVEGTLIRLQNELESRRLESSSL